MLSYASPSIQTSKRLGNHLTSFKSPHYLLIFFASFHFTTTHENDPPIECSIAEVDWQVVIRNRRKKIAYISMMWNKYYLLLMFSKIIQLWLKKLCVCYNIDSTYHKKLHKCIGFRGRGQSSHHDFTYGYILLL